ncbi:MAG: hypothetical protein M3Q46_00290 [Verrucomicrobiota bacterium]|nr:hypothetical protein [Verrucomicrobiota bacterium]
MPKVALTETPFFIAVVAAIEKKIGEGDRIARANNVSLSDAQIIAVLNRVAANARGQSVREIAPRNPAEQILHALAGQLSLLRASIFEMKPGADGREVETLFPTEHWVAAIRVVQKSIRHGTGKLRGSRGFLDSLSLFLSQPAPAQS